jgi:cytidylate kinase
MSIITVSRGSYSKGKEVAEKAAKRLDYECISRDILLEASEDFNTSEIKLVRAIHDAPSILDRFVYGREKYIAFIQAAILRHFRKDNVVYAGLAGHFFAGNVSHVLKVRIVADFEDRVQNEMEREGISAKEAASILKKDDNERIKWSKHLHGIDTRDPALYDLVIHIGKISVDDAVEIICGTVALEHFKTTPESQKALENLALAAEVKAALVNTKPDVEVEASNGTVRVKTEALESETEALIKKLEKMAESVTGVKEVKVDVHMRSRVDL